MLWDMIDRKCVGRRERGTGQAWPTAVPYDGALTTRPDTSCAFAATLGRAPQSLQPTVKAALCHKSVHSVRLQGLRVPFGTEPMSASGAPYQYFFWCLFVITTNIPCRWCCLEGEISIFRCKYLFRHFTRSASAAATGFCIHTARVVSSRTLPSSLFLHVRLSRKHSEKALFWRNIQYRSEVHCSNKDICMFHTLFSTLRSCTLALCRLLFGWKCGTPHLNEILWWSNCNYSR